MNEVHFLLNMNVIISYTWTLNVIITNFVIL